MEGPLRVYKSRPAVDSLLKERIRRPRSISRLQARPCTGRRDEGGPALRQCDRARLTFP